MVFPDERALVSYEDYRVAAERSLDGVFITVPDGRILYANAAARAMLRATEDEIIRKGRQGFTPAGDPRWEAAVEERARTGQTKFVAPMVRTSGSRFLAEVTSSVFKGSGGELRTVVIMRDVTDRTRLELRSAALHEITGAVLTGTDTSEVLTLVGCHARRLLEASDAAIVTATDKPGYVQVSAVDGTATSELLGRAYPPDSLAAQVMAEGHGLLVEDLTAAAATEDGVKVGLGPGIIVPIASSERVFGVLMVGAQPGNPAYDVGDLDCVKVFADAAAIALAVGEARSELEALHRRTSEQLQHALDGRVIIEQAKGFIAANRGINSDEAFDRLRKYARSHNTNVHDIASRVMDRTLML
jgi:PAS domain S-box-containing protein